MGWMGRYGGIGDRGWRYGWVGWRSRLDGGKKKTEGWGIEGGDKDGLGGGGWSLADDGINGGIGDGCICVLVGGVGLDGDVG